MAYRLHRAGIIARSGASLALELAAEFFPYAGIWITRGFWKRLHHWAIEPTNAPVDRFSDNRKPSHVSLLAQCEVREWTLTVKLSLAHETAGCSINRVRPSEARIGPSPMPCLRNR